MTVPSKIAISDPPPGRWSRRYQIGIFEVQPVAVVDEVVPVIGGHPAGTYIQRVKTLIGPSSGNRRAKISKKEKGHPQNQTGMPFYGSGVAQHGFHTSTSRPWDRRGEPARSHFVPRYVMYIIKPANNTNDSRQTGRVNAFDFGTAKRRRVSLGNRLAVRRALARVRPSRMKL
jgi:hypothetical protein